MIVISSRTPEVGGGGEGGGEGGGREGGGEGGDGGEYMPVHVRNTTKTLLYSLTTDCRGIRSTVVDMNPVRRGRRAEIISAAAVHHGPSVTRVVPAGLTQEGRVTQTARF